MNQLNRKAEVKEGSLEAEKKPGSEVVSFFKTIVIFFLLAVFLRATIIEPFKIPSGSMRPTLIEYDHILVTKFNYGLRLPFVPNTVWQYRTPRRGDIVVFTRPDNNRVNIIKRVIGVPGDMIEVEGRAVRINNQIYEEPYDVLWLEGGMKDFPPTKVPEGQVFLMGDNRDHSRDSRFWEDSPFLDMSRIKGKAQIIYWNWHSPGRIGNVLH